MEAWSFYQVISFTVILSVSFRTTEAFTYGSQVLNNVSYQEANITNRAGLTGDSCTTSLDCTFPRTCYDSNGLCSASSASCRCVPTSGAQSCTASTECVFGEGCVNLTGGQYCVSCGAVEKSSSMSFLDDTWTCLGSSINRDDRESSSDNSRTVGFTGDPCTSSSDCFSPLACKKDGYPCSSSSSSCICMPRVGLERCEASSDCLSGEGCTNVAGYWHCISCVVVRNTSQVSFVDDAPMCSRTDNGSTSVESTAQPSTGTGFTGDSCSSSSDCVFPRECQYDIDLCSGSSPGCVCRQTKSPNRCDASRECEYNEGCGVIDGDQYCLSCDMVSNFIVVYFVDDAPTCSTSGTATNGEDNSSENSARTGLTGDFCAETLDCTYPRSCYKNGSLCAPSLYNCVCIPVFGPQPCITSSDCVSGEGCADLSGVQYCISCDAVQKSSSTSFIDDASTCPGSEHGGADEDSSAESTSGTGLTGDSCTSDLDCSYPRLCYLGFDECLSILSGCSCRPSLGSQSCTASADCVPGEGCANRSGSSYCISCKVVERSDTLFYIDDAWTCSDSEDGTQAESSPSADDFNDPAEDEQTDGESGTAEDEGEGSDDEAGTESTDGVDSEGGSSPICVSAMHLKQLKSSELVFSKHRRGYVLCDLHGSCATPGHIVVYQSQTMSMSRYCNTFCKSCRRRIMLVNSPRMQYGLRIASLTEGLEFTPLPAKYDTKVEEALLGALVRLGM